MKAVVMKKVGGTDVMEFVDRPEPVARPGHVVVEVAVAGVNFMDIGVRQGMAWTDIPNRRFWVSKALVECSPSATERASSQSATASPGSMLPEVMLSASRYRQPPS